MSVIDLQEVSPNMWRAKYQGNYGVYTVKVKTDGEKTEEFFCSCPSNYYPCKHIPIVEKEIEKRIAESKKSAVCDELTIEQLLKEASHKELYDFIVRQAQYNPEFKNTIVLEFAHKAKNAATNNYSLILRKALRDVEFDHDDLDYDYSSLEIDILDRWLDKAQTYIERNNPQEAVLICKACIEEFAAWHDKQDDDIIEYVDEDYQIKPFKILIQTLTLQGADNKALFDYCKSEMSKPIYQNMEMYNGFNKLILKLSAHLGSNYFIVLQDKLLKEIDDKSSYEAKKILNYKIDFYKSSGQADKARQVMEENLQIESFRKQLTEELITEKRYSEAKKLINDFLSAQKDNFWGITSWYDMKLQIAQEEKDTLTIRNITYRYIEKEYKSDYFEIFKSTFNPEEWPDEREKLIRQYEKVISPKRYNESIADLLFAEKQEERLLEYIKKHFSLANLEKFHSCFSTAFPDKTLVLFRQAIDVYVRDNKSRGHYEYILSLFDRMVKIEGGKKTVKAMVTEYQVNYKTRKVMIELFTDFAKRL